MNTPSSELERHERSGFFSGIFLIPGKQGVCKFILPCYPALYVRSISAGRFKNVCEAFVVSNTPTII